MLIGSWLHDGAERVTSIQQRELVAAWGQRRGQRKITGVVHGASARVTLFEMGFAYDGTETGWERKHHGWAFADMSSGKFKLVLMRGGAPNWDVWQPVSPRQ